MSPFYGPQCTTTDIRLKVGDMTESMLYYIGGVCIYAWSYREDVLQPGGTVGGRCTLDADRLRSEGAHKSPLQSWFAELQHYTELPNFTSHQCDVVIDKPTILIKLDAGLSVYSFICLSVCWLVMLQATSDPCCQTSCLWLCWSMDRLSVCSSAWANRQRLRYAAQLVASRATSPTGLSVCVSVGSRAARYKRPLFSGTVSVVVWMHCLCVRRTALASSCS